MLREMEDLGRNVEHIKEIVAMQQSYAKMLRRGRNAAVAGSGGGRPAHERRRLRRGTASTILREFAAGAARSLVDKHKVLQILINLIRNAKYAMRRAGRGRQAPHAADRPACPRLRPDQRVATTASASRRKTSTRIFDHGFTTRARRPRLRPAQRRPGRPGDWAAVSERPQRRPGPGRHFLPGIARS